MHIYMHAHEPAGRRNSAINMARYVSQPNTTTWLRRWCASFSVADGCPSRPGVGTKCEATRRSLASAVVMVGTNLVFFFGGPGFPLAVVVVVVVVVVVREEG